MPDQPPVVKDPECLLKNSILANAIDTLCADAHANAKSKGWWDESKDVNELKEFITDSFNAYGQEIKPEERDPLLTAVDRLSARNLGEQIALMHSELSEALEWERKQPGAPSDHIPGFTGLEEEFADVLIRIFDTSAGMKLRLGEAVLAKMAFNSQRPHKHGGKRF
jgi:NTP pyrophosphatase (non-canonical NTP hydrolase)